MAQLEELKPGIQVSSILPAQAVTLVDVKWHGANAVELVYKRADSLPGTQLLYGSDQDRLQIVQAGRRWTFAVHGSAQVQQTQQTQ
jgi:hypothetical protein